MSRPSLRHVAVIGGGPAGLMAAETARAAGVGVDVFESKGSVGRKLLIAGKGGLNLTHSEPFPAFVQRYGARSGNIEPWLADFGPDALQEWARGLGIECFIGSSGRVFPLDLKAAPLLRGWVRRLRDSGVRFHAKHYCEGIDASGSLRFRTDDGERSLQADAVVLALGGGSWPQLGSDGSWVPWLERLGALVATLRPSNCGFDVHWSEHFATRFAGQPIKPVVLSWSDKTGIARRQQGELVVTATGIEGSLIYAASGALRDAIADNGVARIELDLAPGRSAERLAADLNRLRKGRSLTEHLRRSAGIEGVKTSLLYECLSKADLTDPGTLALRIKSLPLSLKTARPIAEAISSAGGVRFESLDERLMLRDRPGVFCAGEMIDWEAPTGGYLLTACFASGRIAGAGAAAWLSDSD